MNNETVVPHFVVESGFGGPAVLPAILVLYGFESHFQQWLEISSFLSNGEGLLNSRPVSARVLPDSNMVAKNGPYPALFAGGRDRIHDDSAFGLPADCFYS